MVVLIETKNQDIISFLSDLRLLNRVDWIKSSQEESSVVMSEFVLTWYDKQGRELFLNARLPTHGAGRKSTRWFEDEVLSKWEVGDVLDTGFMINNHSQSFGKKVYGGTIFAKNARALTIPICPEAHGHRASEYSDQIAKLFRPKDKDYLAHNINGDKIKVVYLLRTSVSIKSNAELLPQEELLIAAYEQSLSDAIYRNVKIFKN